MSRATVYDITDRRYIQQELKANEELLRLFVKHTPAAIAMFDTDMRLSPGERSISDGLSTSRAETLLDNDTTTCFQIFRSAGKRVHRRILAGAVERMNEDPYQLPDGSQGGCNGRVCRGGKQMGRSAASFFSRR